MKKQVLVIGGGIAGMEASNSLSQLGYEVVLIERGNSLGGHLAHWSHLFPNLRPAHEIVDKLRRNIGKSVSVRLNTSVSYVNRLDGFYHITTSDKETFIADAILIATGFDIFDAGKKEEYGYGIYDNVITSADLEKMMASNKIPLTHSGKMPNRVGFVHCVGSRDEKIGNSYCSRLCCVTAVKQAIAIQKAFVDAEVFCFYMDMRMYGRHFEEMYKEAQEKWNIQFIRGRISETCENADGSVLIKAEDTLMGRPLKMNVDLLVLMAGMVPSSSSSKIKDLFGLYTADDRFFMSSDSHLGANETHREGIFLAGACKGPSSVDQTIADARAAAMKIHLFLKKNTDKAIKPESCDYEKLGISNTSWSTD